MIDKSDHEFKLLFDAANRVLQAVILEQKSASSAIRALEHMDYEVRVKLANAMDKMTREIEASAQETAHKAADILSEHFEAADAAANEAKRRYDRSARYLGLKWVGCIGLLQILFLLLTWIVIGRAIPSKEELASRRASVEQLEHHASELRIQSNELMNKINVMQRKIFKLETKGANLERTPCRERSNDASVLSNK
jgi:hypothetical protein